MRPRGGQPTKYRKEYCKEAVKYMSEGFSAKAFAGSIGVSLSTVYLWRDTHPEFSEALKAGQAGAADWWEKTLRQVARNGIGSAPAAIFGVKNRSQEEWKDKHEVDHTSAGEPLKGITITRAVIDPASIDPADLAP